MKPITMEEYEKILIASIFKPSRKITDDQKRRLIKELDRVQKEMKRNGN